MHRWFARTSSTCDATSRPVRDNDPSTLRMTVVLSAGFVVCRLGDTRDAGVHVDVVFELRVTATTF